MLFRVAMCSCSSSLTFGAIYLNFLEKKLVLHFDILELTGTDVIDLTGNNKDNYDLFRKKKKKKRRIKRKEAVIIT